MNLRSRSLAAFAMFGLLLGLVPISPVRASTGSVEVTIDGVVQETVYAGDLIRGTTFSAVYYMGEDGFRYVFPNEKTYFTWYSDFDDVKVISNAALAKIQIGGNVTYRPGSRMIKINSDPKTYMVAHGGALRWVSTEAIAVELYGANWNTKIDDVPDGYFSNYSVTTPITILSSGMNLATLEYGATTSISDDKDLTDFHMVYIDDMTYTDVDTGSTTVITTIDAGETVMFLNMDTTKHTATADDDLWGTGTLSTEGGMFVRRFKTPGTYYYHCTYHPTMTGMIVVN